MLWQQRLRSGRLKTLLVGGSRGSDTSMLASFGGSLWKHGYPRRTSAKGVFVYKNKKLVVVAQKKEI